MKLSKIITLFLVLCFVEAYSELININPDPEGKPWYTGGYEYDPIEQEFIEGLPILNISEEVKEYDLPSSWDNTNLPEGYPQIFRSIFNQVGGSCAQASAIGYMFAFEINRDRISSSNDANRRYPTHFTYNFVNHGSNKPGSFYADGIRIATEFGIPNCQIWSDVTEEAYNSGYSTYPPDEMGRDPQIWMSGYDYYYEALKDRVKVEPGYDTGGFLIANTSTEEGLENLKYYLRYHNLPIDESSSYQSGIGGLAVFSTILGTDAVYTRDKVFDEPIMIEPSTDASARHAMTVVGYDDIIAWDLDEEYDLPRHDLDKPLEASNYVWDHDLNIWTDTLKPMEEWEVGAIKVVNSWGQNSPFAETGYFYVPYRFMNTMRNFIGINVETDVAPLMTYKVSFQHHNRKGAIPKVGLSADPSSSFDDIGVTKTDFYAFTAKRAGELPMRGNECYDPIEYCLKVPESSLAKKYFFIIDDDIANDLDPAIVPDGFIPEIVNFELIDKRYKEIHVECDEANKEILDNGETAVSIIYDIIKNDIHDDITLQNNIGITPPGSINQINIEDGKNITLEDGTKLYFSNSGLSTDFRNLRSTINSVGEVEFIGYGNDSDNKFMILNNDEFIVDGNLSIYDTKLHLDNESILTLVENSELKIGEGSELFLTYSVLFNQNNGSKISVDNNGLLNLLYDTILEIDQGSELEILNGANITFGTSSKIVAKSGSTLRLAGDVSIPARSQIVIEEGAYLIIEDEVSITGELQILSGSNISISDNSHLNLNSYYDYTLNSSSNINLGLNSKLSLSNEAYLFIDERVSINAKSGSSLIIGQDCHLESLLEPDYSEVTPDNYINISGNDWEGIVCESNSKIFLTRAKINGAKYAVSGTPNELLLEGEEYSCIIEQCEITNCENGIDLANCNNFKILNNTFVGIEDGAGITAIVSDGTIENNEIENYNYGVRAILSSPVMVNNNIFNNKKYGLLVSGHDALPVLKNYENASGLNNSIYNNGSAWTNTLYPYGQIGIMPVGSIYLYEGMNNIYSGDQNTIPEIPCISTAGLIPVLSPLEINILAAGNYWGSSEVTDEFFALEDPYYAQEYPYNLHYQGWSKSPFVSGVTPPPSSYSSIEPPRTESIILSNGFSLEDKGNYKASIKQYEHVIDKYENSPESYVALARLPYVYLKAGISPQSLISTYNDGLESENTTYKKFFKEMKIATHIKGKNYPTAKLLAEEMKVEALTEEEVILAEIDIAICDMMMEPGSKEGKSSIDHMSKLNGLLSKTYGDEGEDEVKTEIVESALPSEFALYQNYPNPFNPTTEIKFALPVASDVELNVYNINGQLVFELVNGNKEVGLHTVNFDASNFNSGMYFYTLEANGMSITKKMILTK
ncbi:MAG: T9SS type A sorting domain-containing protein [Candidatus Delongbacteria bacterium]|jgi:parallel beta-helix repeat protein|nr:T9SS type A sorting domain-containing protein [Candidatus Delongbacteria bacterium]